MIKKQLHNTKRREPYIGGALFLFAILLGAWFLFVRDRGVSEPGGNEGLTPVDSVSHIHGLAVDAADTSKLYIATHHGLFMLAGDTDLFRIGKSKDDFMGFSLHPTDSNIFFASGHPVMGGNLGVLKSEDQGRSWERLASGVRGPVDFHAMTVSPANPQILYGWYQNALQRSTDGGTTWEVLSASGLANVISLAADSQNEKILYAGTTNGLLVSKDQGVSWSSFSNNFSGDVVIALALNPGQSQEVVVFSQKGGLTRSKDGGTTWEKINGDFGKDIIVHLAWSKRDPSVLYTATKESILYKTNNGGETWKKIR